MKEKEKEYKGILIPLKSTIWNFVQPEKLLIIHKQPKKKHTSYVSHR